MYYIAILIIILLLTILKHRDFFTSPQITTHDSYFSVNNNGDKYKLSRKCPHMGCNVDWEKSDKQFICPCHQSKFNLDGSLISGPAKSGLEKI